MSAVGPTSRMMAESTNVCDSARSIVAGSADRMPVPSGAAVLQIISSSIETCKIFYSDCKIKYAMCINNAKLKSLAMS